MLVWPYTASQMLEKREKFLECENDTNALQLALGDCDDLYTSVTTSAINVSVILYCQ